MICHVFLSFSLGDEGLVNVFRGQAANRQSVLFHDYSIKEAFEPTWKMKAERLIRACSVTLCLIGKTTYRSKAVDWEIRKSTELGKTVRAVRIVPTVPGIPPALAELSVQPLPWDMERIIGELNLKFCNLPYQLPAMVSQGSFTPPAPHRARSAGGSTWGGAWWRRSSSQRLP